MVTLGDMAGGWLGAMVRDPVLSWAMGAAGVALVAAVLGERLHARRVARVARLAFGPSAGPAAWARLAPLARVLGVVLCAFGCTVLMRMQPQGGEGAPDPKASRHVLIALDVSPSMLIKDAGPDTPKVSRSQWAGKVVEGILDRLDMKQTRISLVGFYTKALTVLDQTTDRNVVANVFDGLELYVAFEGGPTDLAGGVNAALDASRAWARGSTTLVVVSDGDASTNIGNIRMPPAIADAIVIGVGDPFTPTLVSGHSSKQEPLNLKQLAARLGGYYHQGNRLQLPSSVVGRLTMSTPDAGLGIGLREAALVCVGVGGGLVGLTGPALLVLGLKRSVVREREGARVRAKRVESSGVSGRREREGVSAPV
ncbi:MAG: VWA domain-containing protein [Tepidisphaera sp.]|nr:VWA domain-containing protein [Tepidisphaera sp.]